MQFEEETGSKRIESLALEQVLLEGAVFQTEAGRLTATFYAPGIFRLRMGKPDGPDYGMLVADSENTRVSVSENVGGWVIKSGNLTVRLYSGPLRIQFFQDDQLVLESTRDGHITGKLRIPNFAKNPNGWTVGLGLHSGEPVYGLGEQFGRLNHRGELINSWNEDSLGVNSEWAYKNVPFAWSPEGWGLMVHTPARVSHGVGYPQWSNRSYILKIEDAALDLFFFLAKTPAQILERYTHLTGRPPELPRWSYGVWMSRAYYRTAEEAISVARKVRERQIPCDVFTLDGRAWLEVDTRFAFEWDANRYPNPAAWCRELKQLNMRLCVWEYPLVSVRNPIHQELARKGFFLKDKNDNPYPFKFDPEPFGSLLVPLPDSGIIDFTRPEAYRWWADKHQELFETGVDVIKTDFGEQVPEDAYCSNGDDGIRMHNVYAMLYNRCVFEATQKYFGEGLVWDRSAWIGSQRYPVQWGGDPQKDWGGLEGSIRGTQSWGNTGGAYQTHDIGGFYLGVPETETYIRWTQAGVMSSHTRFHGTGVREPWEFGEETEKIVQEWLALRYRLIPYLQGCAVEAHHTGMPVVRSMALAFPEDPCAWGFEEQYMFGPSLLVAPVLRPGGKVRVYLPKGTWHDFWTRETVEGGQVLNLTMPLDRIPVFGREGTFVPMGPAVQHTGELTGDLQVEEVIYFGSPKIRMELPGMILPS